MSEVKTRQQERIVTFGGPNINTPTQQGYAQPPSTRK